MRFGLGRITPIVKYLLIINIIIYVAMILTPAASDAAYRYLFLHFPGTKNFIASQFITAVFVHFPNSMGVNTQTGDLVFFPSFSTHLLFNMIALWLFGSMVESVWRSKRFLNFYLAAGLGASVINVLVMFIMNKEGAEYRVMGGASGAIYGVMVAAAYLFPNNVVNIYGIIPIKIKFLVILLIAFDLFMGVRGKGTVGHWAHLGGAFIGLIYCYGGNLKRWMK